MLPMWMWRYLAYAVLLGICRFFSLFRFFFFTYLMFFPRHIFGLLWIVVEWKATCMQCEAICYYGMGWVILDWLVILLLESYEW